MGKLVKYCSSCEEGFSEKFGYCPNCAAPLEAYEMNLVGERAATPDPVIEHEIPPTVQTSTTEIFDEAEAPAVYDDGYVIVEARSNGHVEQSAIETEEFGEAAYGAAPADRDNHLFRYTDDDVLPPIISTYKDDEYHLTLVEEKNVKQRNLLLLGSTALISTIAVVATIVSLFNQTLGVDAINEGDLFAYVVVDEPMTIAEEEQKKDKDQGGGGGGGGREEKTPTSQGDLADQTREKIFIHPDKSIVQKDFDLVQPKAATEGDRKFEKKYNQYGDPNGFGVASNGMGSGGGQGSGYGTGQGSGYGTGTGSGTGSGSGSGSGSGNGGGSGGGDGGPPPPKAVGVTSPYRIIAKPKATYTDAARTNNVQGSVTLKIVLLASGQVGSITPIKGLPHGLTEQAIAAARQIRFEPKKINGVPVSTTVTFQYGFNIY
jgi:TonB family protein